MSTRSQRIKQLIEESNLSYQELEKITGVKKSSLQRYASGTTAKIPLDVIERLSKTFRVSQEYLMGWSDNRKIKSPEKKPLSEGEEMLLNLFRQIPADKQELVLDMIRVALSKK